MPAPGAAPPPGGERREGGGTGHTGPAAAVRVRRLARLLDAAVRVPGTNIRIGLDSLIGLVPGGGDLAGALLSAWIVLTAARLGAPAAVLLRMTVNLAADALIGTVPLVGDLLDIGWKANLRNVALLERHLEDPVRARRRSALALGGVAAGLLAVIVVLSWVVWEVVGALVGALVG